MKVRFVALLVGISLLLGAGLARAHPLAPALLELREQGGGRVEVKFKTPAKRLPGTNLVPLLPESCSTTAPPTLEREGTGIVERYAVACNTTLAGARVGIRGLEASGTDALLRVELADGRHIQSVLRSSEPSVVIPERPSRLGVLRDYVRLGVLHIASGLDHLLFVFGLLVLVAARTGPLLKTVTAFTVGHSVTLSLAVLGFVAFPSGLVELAIAGSIFVLGAELVQAPGQAPGTLRRFPWAMAGAFGLLHGFGFAGALAEVGLPSGEIPLALFAFNVGIELGQLAFIGLVLAAWRLVVRVQVPLPRWSSALPAYGIGCLAAYWCIERAAGLIR
ncbi:MAG: HupE/UreJ family protein [bacterium]|nr:HupE/UreJ family protein [bacterium]